VAVVLAGLVGGVVAVGRRATVGVHAQHLGGAASG
jgi:hypothetical protein